MAMVALHVLCHPTTHFSLASQELNQSKHVFINSSSSLVAQATSKISSRRLLLSSCIIISTVSPTTFFSFSDASLSSNSPVTSSNDAIARFYELPNSGGVKALDLRVGTGSTPIDGDQQYITTEDWQQSKGGVLIRLMITKIQLGNQSPSPSSLAPTKYYVISGIEVAVRSMRVGGVRRVVIPPSQGYQNTTQEPLPPNFFDRQRLFTTIFNPTRLANGEGSTLGTLMFDIELVNVKH